MEQSSSFVQHQPFQLYLLRKEFQLDKLHQKNGEEGAGTKGRRKNCGKIKTYSCEPVFNYSGKFIIREKSDYILRSGETHSCGETGKQDEKKCETLRSAEFSSEAERCIPWRVDGWQRGETCRNRGESGSMGISESESWSVHEDEVTCKPVAYKKGAVKPAASSIPEISGNPEAEMRKWHIFLHLLGSRVLHRQKSVRLWERPTIEDLQTKWRTSTWTWLFGECLWIPLFKQQFSLVRTMIRIYHLLRIISEEVIRRN